ncbi:MAG: amidohydrolase family protein [Saprospiraceae bacterium]|nr:amidohydrolase family protein [Saprospiraceae bacterium]
MKTAFLVILISLSLSDYGLAQLPDVFKIVDVNVVPMTGDIIKYRQQVTVSKGIITAIKPWNSNKPAVLDTTIIPATGKYLTPGWAEMHAHIPTPTEEGNTDLVYETLFLYLSQGITTIRGMLGHPSHLDLREEVIEKNIESPRIYTSSPSMNGNSIPDEATAEEKTIQYAAAGYDFLKVHPGIKRNVFDKMVQVAGEQNLPFAGHVPLDVGIEHALTSRYKSIDHLDGYIEGLAPFALRRMGGFFGVSLADTLDLSQIDRLAEMTVSKKVAVVPTQTLFTRWLAPDQLETQMRDPEMIYISPATRFGWRQNKEQMQANLNLGSGRYDRFLAARKKLIRSLQEAGVLMLLGSDAPQVMNVPGFSIHREMEAMADAGLTPYQILKSGTVNVAQYFQNTDQLGTIEIGKNADLVVLEENPLEDIRNCKKIHAVIFRGQILSRDAIDQRLSEIAKKYQE